MIFKPMDESALSSMEQKATLFSLAVAIGMKFTPGIVAISLLYINQLMSYYSRSGMEKGLLFTEVVEDIATPKMFAIAMIGGIIAQFLTRGQKRPA